MYIPNANNTDEGKDKISVLHDSVEKLEKEVVDKLHENLDEKLKLVNDLQLEDKVESDTEQHDILDTEGDWVIIRPKIGETSVDDLSDLSENENTEPKIMEYIDKKDNQIITEDVPKGDLNESLDSGDFVKFDNKGVNLYVNGEKIDCDKLVPKNHQPLENNIQDNNVILKHKIEDDCQEAVTCDNSTQKYAETTSNTNGLKPDVINYVTLDEKIANLNRKIDEEYNSITSHEQSEKAEDDNCEQILPASSILKRDDAILVEADDSYELKSDPETCSNAIDIPTDSEINITKSQENHVFSAREKTQKQVPSLWSKGSSENSSSETVPTKIKNVNESDVISSTKIESSDNDAKLTCDASDVESKKIKDSHNEEDIENDKFTSKIILLENSENIEMLTSSTADVENSEQIKNTLNNLIASSDYHAEPKNNSLQCPESKITKKAATIMDKDEFVKNVSNDVLSDREAHVLKSDSNQNENSHEDITSCHEPVKIVENKCIINELSTPPVEGSLSFSSHTKSDNCYISTEVEYPKGTINVDVSSFTDKNSEDSNSDNSSNTIDDDTKPVQNLIIFPEEHTTKAEVLNILAVPIDSVPKTQEENNNMNSLVDINTSEANNDLLTPNATKSNDVTELFIPNVNKVSANKVNENNYESVLNFLRQKSVEIQFTEKPLVNDDKDERPIIIKEHLKDDSSVNIFPGEIDFPNKHEYLKDPNILENKSTNETLITYMTDKNNTSLNSTSENNEPPNTFSIKLETHPLNVNKELMELNRDQNVDKDKMLKNMTLNEPVSEIDVSSLPEHKDSIAAQTWSNDITSNVQGRNK